MDETAADIVQRRFERGAAEASRALSKWLGRSAEITVRQIDRLPLATAANALGTAETPLCVCAMPVAGRLEGLLLLACDDTGGLTLCDLLLGDPAGTTREWGEMARSAFAETANIVGCAYLNAIAAQLPPVAGAAGIVPAPPWFMRDYPAAVMDSVLLEQALGDATVFLTRTEFRIDATPVRCALVFVPRPAGLGDVTEGRDDPDRS
jgi:chemotaxis protein CheC